MSVSGQPTGDRCGKWMPRAKEHCGRMPGHGGECRTTGSPNRPQGTADGAAAGEDTRHPGGQVPLEPGVQAQAHGPDPGAVRPDARGAGVRLRHVPARRSRKTSASASTMTTPAARPSCRPGAAVNACAACCASPAMSPSGTSRRTPRWRWPTWDQHYVRPVPNRPGVVSLRCYVPATATRVEGSLDQQV